MRYRALLGLLLSSALLLACGSGEVPQADVERARAALKPFRQQLFAALTEALEKGPEHAIHVCRNKAPQIAAGLSVDGVMMGRTSHKLRNPKNAPQPWMEDLLADYLENPENRQPRAARLSSKRFAYVEPIEVKGLCLNCHGQELDPNVATRIKVMYPDDKATGFEVGDFCGIFWITMPLE